MTKPILNQGRQFEIDLAKALAIFFMIAIHVADLLTDLSTKASPAFLYTVNFLGGPLAAPVFMFALGIGVVYSRRNDPKTLAKRGLNLFLMGYGLNLVRGGFMAFFDWQNWAYELLTVDILHFAGLTFLALALMKSLKLSTWQMLLVGLLLQVIGQVSSPSLTNLTTLGQAGLGLLIYTGNVTAFPAFHWLIYPLAGLCFGQVLQRVSDKGSFYRHLFFWSFLIFLVSSGLTVLLGGNLVDHFYTAYYQQNPLSSLWILSTVGMALAFYYLISLSLPKQLVGWVTFLSSQVNQLYLIQWILIAYSSFWLNNLPHAWLIPLTLVYTALTIALTKLIVAKKS